MPLNRQRGFNLIEALVAVVVLSMGLLGIAALQLTSMRNTQGSYYRSQATTLMNDLSERIYANTPGAGSYAGFDSSASGACSPAPTTICAMESSTVIATCTPAQMAAYDQYAVGCGTQGANSLLSNGRMQIDCTPASAVCAVGNPLTITVQWTEQGTVTNGASAVAADTAQSIVMVIQP